MLEIVDRNIRITRGNMLPITVSADNDIDGNDYEFQIGDVIRFQIFDTKNVNKVYLKKDFKIDEATIEKTTLGQLYPFDSLHELAENLPQ